MIGTIRKHSKWLWWFIAAATIVSFVWWGANVPSRGSGNMAAGDFGRMYGEKITQQEYLDARHNFDLLYWFRDGFQWPDRNPNISKLDMDKQAYVTILELRKAKSLGIYASDSAAATVANNLLSSPDLIRAFHVRGRTVPMDLFVKNILQPVGLTLEDFERFARNQIIIQELEETMGLAGQLFTPQDAEAAWRRDHQEREAQIVFFSASNYLSQVAVTPQAVSQFYTNYLASYRLPDRVQVSYVEFNVSNYFTAAEEKIGRTNLNFQVASIFNEQGMDAVPDAKTPDEAKSEIRQAIIRQQAMKLADQEANDFANAVISQTPPRPEALAAIARQKNFTVKTTEPFAAQYGPKEFIAPESFIKAAFSLTPEEPFAGPVQGATGYYEIALEKTLASEIPSLVQIRDRVTRDYQMQQATALAQNAGTNFVATLNLKLVTGRAFAGVCAADNLQPETLPPFSLSTASLPELQNRAGLPQVKQATFGTPVGRASGFEPTDDGGFIIFVQKQLPVDEAAMKSDLPQYIAQIRRERVFEVYQDWVQVEANRQLRDTPVFKELEQSNGAK